MYNFFQFLICFQYDVFPNSIFYVFGVPYIYTFLFALFLIYHHTIKRTTSVCQNILSVKSGGCSQEEIYQHDECVYREAEEEASCYKRVPQIE